MTEPGKLHKDNANGIGTITFSHPKSNSLPGTLLADMAVAVRELGEDASVKVIVIGSEGDGAFCAGASFSELQAVSTAEEGTAFFMGFARLILAMIRAPKFIITRVQGKTVGGGVGIVAASDYAIAARAASIRLSELAVGIGPFIVGLPIQRKIGLAAFSALAVDADWRDSAWAERHGLFSQLVDDKGALDAAVQERAAMLAASNPDAMARLKAVFWSETEQWEKLLSARAAESGRLVISDFTRRAISSKN